MGKNIRHKHACAPIQNHPGFIWSLFNILKHNHWRYIKKRLPHKRLVGRRHSAGSSNPGNNAKPSNNDDSQAHSNAEVNNSTVEERSKRVNSEERSKKPNSEEKSKKHSETKSSVKARIKALITEDRSKRKARHHRSSTYPVQAKSAEDEPLHELQSSDQDPSNDECSRIFNQNGNTSPAFGSLNPLYLMSEESSSSDIEENGIVQNNHLDDDVKKSNKKETFLEDGKNKEKQVFFDPKAMHAKELADNDDTSPRRSKAFLDALNLINLNKDFLLKVLQDPGSPLARHFHSQQALSSKMVLTKAGSFPAPGSSGKGVSPSNLLNQHKGQNDSFAKDDGYEKKMTGFDAAEDTDKQATMPSIARDYRPDGIQKLNEAMDTIADNNSSGSGLHVRKRGRNQMVVKRFKDLRQKIRHVIKESKDEKHRITMDAVLHKVPHKYGFSKDLRQDIFDQFKETRINKSKKDGSKLKHMRTSSLNAPLDRYLLLYECSFHKEDKSHVPEKSHLGTEAEALPSRKAPKTLGRILSLPEMKSYSYKTEDSPDTVYTEKQTGEFATSSSLDEREKVSEDQSVLDASVEDQKQEQLIDCQETTYFVNDINEANAEREICDEFARGKSDIDSEIKSSDGAAEESPCLEPGFTFDKASTEFPTSQEDSGLNLTHSLCNQVGFLGDLQETSMDTHQISETETDQEKAELPGKQLDGEVMHDVHVEAKDKAKFVYVRDVLELSGFSSPESITTWHSDYQPVDPSVYEEVTGCMFCDPECSGYDEGGNCNHLPLFDLINEVLMEIYELCYHYCPMPLSCLCHIHPMPVGYSVLKEVWFKISWYLRSRPNEDGQSLDYLISRDLSKIDGWMNLQFDSECVGIEVEDLIFDELLEELILD